MMNQQKNRPRLGRSISVPSNGKTKNSGRLKRNSKCQENSFHVQRSGSMVTRKDNHFFNRHPYKMDSENSTLTNSKIKCPFKEDHTNRMQANHDNNDLRILNADTSSKKIVMHSVIDVANRLKTSLSIENDSESDSGEIRESNKFCNDIPNNDSLCNQENKTEIMSELRDIGNVRRDETLSASEPESDDEAIVIPCFDDEFPNEAEDSKENRRMSEARHGQCNKEEHDKPSQEDTENELNCDMIEHELRKLNTIPLFESESEETDFSFILISKTPLKSSLCCRFDTSYIDNHEKGSAIDSPSVLADQEDYNDIRDMLCTESPPEKEMEKTHSLQLRDYREALRIRQNCYTCPLCGSNLEFIPFNGPMPFSGHGDTFFSDLDDFQNYFPSPYLQNNSDLYLFCTLCCEPRLVQSYNIR